MWLEMNGQNTYKIFIPNIASHFLRIVNNINSFTSNEQEQWKNFLYEIWLNSWDMQTYLQLIWSSEKIGSIDYEDVKKFNTNIKNIFQNNSEYIKCILLDNSELKNFLNKINDKNRAIQIIIEYMKYSFDLLIINYETKRISLWIFNITK